MPEDKPMGGFLEVGDIAPGEDAYPWESEVFFHLGSNGVVYAEVEREVDALPTLDDAGHVIESEVHCPKCQSHGVSVVQVSCLEHRRHHTGRWPLDKDGFDWGPGQRPHWDRSTDDEVVECDECGERGDLKHFNFQTA